MQIRSRQSGDLNGVNAINAVKAVKALKAASDGGFIIV